MTGSATPRVLHINDCAFSTTNLMTAARRCGLPWRYQPLAVTDPAWHGVGRIVRRGVRGAGWLARLAANAARADLLHIHFATVVQHTGWVPRPYVLHLHGTDIRSYQYDPHLGPLVRRAVEGARAVLYSTPDLAPHIRWREDARLFPVPIDVAALPTWQPDPVRTVFFASRWDEVKGSGVQLAAARALGTLAGVRILGIDWGPDAAAARAAGVTLLPRLAHADFLAALARAHVVVGQPTGMLAASELEALGIGVPVVAPLQGEWYVESGAAVPPVLGGTALADAHVLPPQDPATGGVRMLAAAEIAALAEAVAALASEALADPAAASARLAGAAWLAAEHGADAGVVRLLGLYPRVLDGGRP